MGFFSKKKAGDPSEANQEIKQALASTLLSELTYSFKDVMSDDDIDKMLKDDDISIAVENMKNVVAGREWKIGTINQEDSELAKEIENRFANIDIASLSRKVIEAKFYKNALFYLIWNQEEYRIDKILQIPKKSYSYSRDKKNWYVKTGSSETYIENPFEFLLVINDESIDLPQGKSDLETLFKQYQVKASIDEKIASIINKYGEIITWFLYDVKAKKEEIKEQAQMLKDMYGKQVVAIPGRQGTEQGKQFGFISLADLKLDMHFKAAEKYEKKVKRHIQGSTLATDESSGGGNFALGSVHADEKEKKEESNFKFLRDSLQHLIKLDGKLYGYDPNLFFFKFEKEKDEEKEIKIGKDKEELNRTKLSKFRDLKELGINVSKEFIAKELGIDVAELGEMETYVEIAKFEKLSQMGYKVSKEFLAKNLGIDPGALEEIEVVPPTEFSEKKSDRKKQLEAIYMKYSK